MASDAFDKVYNVDHSNPLSVLDLALADARFSGHQAWADKLVQARKDVQELVALSARVLRASETNNNGAVMGEATLCAYFESGLRHTLISFEAL